MLIAEDRRTAANDVAADQGPFSPAAIARLAALSDNEFAKLDIAALNLRCAIGLPGSEALDVAASLQKLEMWTNFVRVNTERWLPNFPKAPERCNNSLAEFRMMALATTLKRELGVRYYMPFNEGDANATDSRNLFLHGILSGHGGTCVSMPVVFIAVGRRLGYPLHLVRAAQHYFVRWEEPGGDRFNIEATCNEGWAHPGDDHYETKRPITPVERATGIYMRNLTRREEFGEFLRSRACCLFDNLRFAHAAEILFAGAARFTDDPILRLGWQIATLLRRAVADGWRSGAIRPSRAIDLASVPLSPPREGWERSARAEVERHLGRLARVHRGKVNADYLVAANVPLAGRRAGVEPAVAIEAIIERGRLSKAGGRERI